MFDYSRLILDNGIAHETQPCTKKNLIILLVFSVLLFFLFIIKSANSSRFHVVIQIVTEFGWKLLETPVHLIVGPPTEWIMRSSSWTLKFDLREEAPLISVKSVLKAHFFLVSSIRGKFPDAVHQPVPSLLNFNCKCLSFCGTDVWSISRWKHYQLAKILFRWIIFHILNCKIASW